MIDLAGLAIDTHAAILNGALDVRALAHVLNLVRQDALEAAAKRLDELEAKAEWPACRTVDDCSEAIRALKDRPWVEEQLSRSRDLDRHRVHPRRAVLPRARDRGCAVMINENLPAPRIQMREFLEMKPTWKTRDGREMPIAEMTLSHLENTIRFVERAYARWEDNQAATISPPCFNGEMAQYYAEREWLDAVTAPIEEVYPIYVELVAELKRRTSKKADP